MTGASSGIGLSIAKALSKNNYNVVMADINEEQGSAIAGDIGAFFCKG